MLNCHEASPGWVGWGGAGEWVGYSDLICLNIRRLRPFLWGSKFCISNFFGGWGWEGVQKRSQILNMLFV